MARIDVECDGWRPTPDRIGWLTVAVSLVVIPQTPRVPLWVAGCYAGLVLWRLSHELGWLRRPGSGLRGVLTAAAPLGVFLSFGTVLGRDAGVAMLIALAGLKLLETETLRDAYVVISLASFLVITSFLFSQNIATGIYMGIVVGAIVAALAAINDRAHSLGTWARLRLAGTLILQALPLMAMLFFLFPRLPGPLWGLPEDAHAGVSKLGDSMSPGNISQLSLSGAVAFRVEFHGPPPPPSQRYWRGPVLWRSDGRRWTTWDRSRAPSSLTEVRFEGEAVEYTITLEPHFERWLFALDLPSQLPPDARLTPDLQLMSTRPVRTGRRYRLRSHPHYRINGLGGAERDAALSLPVGFHPHTRALARRWRADAARASIDRDRADRQIVQRGLRYFREQPFHYTLRPPLLRGDTIDEFMFLTRRGFCEFYAAAYTVLMRAAGIPARVVTGYQGGEFNAIGNYFIVRQRDAHAWVEVWLPGSGWTRVDPTAAVAPDRIEAGVDAAFPPTLGPSGLGLQASGSIGRLLRNIGYTWDTFNNYWNQWIIDYGSGRQRRLLRTIGLDPGDWRSLVLGLLAGGGIALGLVAVWLLRPVPEHDRARAIYRRFRRKLARRGWERPDHEGPRDFARRISGARPDLASDVERITSIYLHVRYAALELGPSAHAAAMSELRCAVSRFSP